MKRLHVFLAALLLLAAPLSAQTIEGPPTSIDYQGRVLDSNGNALAPTTPTNYTMQFRIYAGATGGTALWAESQTVTVDKGQFSVRLGEGVPVGSEPRPGLLTLFDARDRYLGLTVIVTGQTPGEISPRLQFLTTPYAMTAQKATLATRATTADSVAQTGGNSSLGATTVTGNLAVAGGTSRLTIAGANVIELGAGVSGKNANAGTIGYATYTPNTLDIVGAGTSVTNRAVKIFAEAGTTFTGPVRLAGTSVLELGQGVIKQTSAGQIGYQTYSSALDIVGAGTAATNRAVKFWSEGGAEFTGSLFFGSRTGQLINLSGTNYGVGVQTNTLYQRSPFRFSWYVGGAHVDTEDSPGIGLRVMTLHPTAGLGVYAAKTVDGLPGSVTVGMDPSGTPGIELRNVNPASSGTDRVGYVDFSDTPGVDYDVRLVMGHRADNTVYAGFDRGARNTRIDFFLNGSPIASNPSCDITLKRDIRPLNGSLDLVLALSPVDFEWRREEFPERYFPAGRSVGFIAQEMQKLVPEAVERDQFGKLTVNFSRVVPYLVGAVQTQQARIAELDAANEALEQRVARLEALVARLAPAAQP